jgi:Tfp pilus assembly protein PilO
MKPVLAFRPRERRLAFIAVMALLSWGVVSWIVQPLWDRVRELQLHVDTQLEKLEAVNRLLAQEPSVVRRHQALAGRLQVDRAGQTEGSLLNELEALSRQSNLKLNLKPHPVKAGEQVSRLDVELDVEGSQEKLLAFLDALLGLPRLVAIERLRISSIPTKAQQLRASLLIQQLTIR